MKLKVMLADDHILFLEGLQYLLETYDINVVGRARTGTEAITKARILKPDIILMDIRMPQLNGLEALKLIKQDMPDIKILMLTTYDEDGDLYNALKYGASGYLFKNTDAKDLIDRMKQVVNGEVVLSPDLASRMLGELNNKVGSSANSMEEKSEDGSDKKLTDRQIEILEVIASGKTYKKAGETLGLSERTVKYHMGRIVEILHLENKAQAIAYAAKSGIVEHNGKQSIQRNEN